jgi:hypothetical protein
MMTDDALILVAGRLDNEQDAQGDRINESADRHVAA